LKGVIKVILMAIPTVVGVFNRTVKTLLGERDHHLRRNSLSVREVDFENLRKNEALLAKAEEIGQIGSWEHDLVTGDDIWSANLCRMLQVDPTKTKLSEQLFWELLHPDDRATVRSMIDWGMKDSHEYKYQSRFILPDGSERTFYTYGKPILDSANQVIKRIGITQDITIRVEAERALMKSEARYRDLVESSHDLICTHDLDGHLLSMNELPARVLGYRVDELIGRRLPDHLCRPYVAEFGEYIERIKKVGFDTGMMAMMTKSGEQRIWEYRNVLRTNGPDEPWVHGIAHDVTAQVEAQRALRKSKARLQALVNSIDEIAFEFDVDGAFLDIWTTNENHLFRPRAQLLGRRISDVFEGTFAASYRAIFRRVLESGKGEDVEYPLNLKDGEHWFLCRVTPIAAADGAYKSICMLARDITERKKTEKSLSLFRVLIDRTNDGIQVVDPHSLQILDVNQKACSDLGFPREEMLAKTIYDINPDLTPEFHANIRKELNRSGSVIKEVVHRRKDGSTYPAEINLSLVHADKCYIVGIVRDITERKAAEVAMRKLSGLLLRAQDEERRRVAREIHDGVGTYIAGLSLTLGKIRAFLDKSNPDHRRAISESRELIRAAGGEIRSVSYLLHPPTLDCLGLKSALDWLVNGFSERSGIEVSLQTPKKIGRFNREIELTLFRVTQEALNNVFRHSKSRSARVRLMMKADIVVLEIVDKGRGIGVSERSPRMTVGISGMKERVNNLGGTFSIQDASRRGCVVRVCLPVASGPEIDCASLPRTKISATETTR
jgi:PAS domain S-box-containing protein